MRRRSAWGAVAVLLALGCGSSGGVRAASPASEQPAKSPGVTSRGSLTPGDAATLAEQMRAPGWESARRHESFVLGESVLVVADYEQTFVPFDGNPRRFRRFGLARPVEWPEAPAGVATHAPRWTVVDVVTVQLTSTGANVLYEERRDVDGDGVSDVVLHYAKMPGPDEQQELGLVALSSRDTRLSWLPLSHLLTPDSGVWGTACWATVDDRAALFVRYRAESASPTAYVWTTYGLRPRPVFGAVLAQGRNESELVRAVSRTNGQPVQDEDDTRRAVVPPDCHAAPGYALLRASGGELELVGGFSESPEKVKRTSELERVVRLEPEESFVWPTKPALN